MRKLFFAMFVSAALPNLIYCGDNCCSYSKVVKKIKPSVVDVLVTRVHSNSNPFAELFDQFIEGFSRFSETKRISKSSGSAVIISKSGLVVTCNHVVEGGDKITVRLADGGEFEAKVIIEDKKNDIAVLKLKGINEEDLPYAEIGDSEKVEAGDHVLAVGNSFGVLTGSVTSGIISSSKRIFNDQVVIQTDAPVNPGNSGGGLFDVEGKLIGIPNAILSRTGASHGVGFAIPSIVVSKILKEIDKTFIPTWFGLVLQDIDAQLLRALNESKKKKISHGVIIVDFEEGSPLKKHLKQKDVITSINGVDVNSIGEIDFIEDMLQSGAEVNMKVWRGGEDLDVTFTAENKPKEKQSDAYIIKGKNILSGYELQIATPSALKKLKLNPDLKGLIIVSSPKSSSQESMFSMQLEEGDVIVSVNGKLPQSIKDLENALKGRGISMKIIKKNGGVFEYSVQQ